MPLVLDIALVILEEADEPLQVIEILVMEPEPPRLHFYVLMASLAFQSQRIEQHHMLRISRKYPEPILHCARGLLLLSFNILRQLGLILHLDHELPMSDSLLDEPSARVDIVLDYFIERRVLFHADH